MRSLLLSAVVGMSALGLPLLAGPSAAQADEAPARLRVLLPADATLTIDGAPTQSTSEVRNFVTPPLEAGKDFHYDLRAHFVRGGNEVTVERRITVRGGQRTEADLNFSGAPATAGIDAAGNQAFYYSPANQAFQFSSGLPTYAPFRGVGPLIPFDPDSPPARGYVGGARDNWKPDFSDPFLLSSGW
jgi:uncharacterized protein (TIGR03000 family)